MAILSPLRDLPQDSGVGKAGARRAALEQRIVRRVD